MSCENYGPYACADNEATARSLAGGLARNDSVISQGIQQEIFDRPPDLAVDLIRRIQRDQDPQGADHLIVEPQFQRTPYGFQDTGRRLVEVQYPDGNKQPIAMLNAQPDQNYYAQVPPQFDPFALATGIVVGGILGNAFRPWQERDHQRLPFDRDGHRWDGQQLRERSPQIGITPHSGFPVGPPEHFQRQPPPAAAAPYPDPRLRRFEPPPPAGQGRALLPQPFLRPQGEEPPGAVRRSPGNEEFKKKKWP